MRYFLIVLTVSMFTSREAAAQTAEDSVKATISRLFEGMKKSDPVMLRSAFADSAILQSIGPRGIENESVADFAAGISKITPGDADERITFDLVKIDGPLAIAWTPYQFWYKGKFSHCGVDSYQLVRIKGEWKIQYLIDTRRKAGCL